MTNGEFIKTYGKAEFYDLKDYVYQRLTILKMDKKLKGFRISNRKGRAQIFLNNGQTVFREFAYIWKNY